MDQLAGRAASRPRAPAAGRRRDPPNPQVCRARAARRRRAAPAGRARGRGGRRAGARTARCSRSPRGPSPANAGVERVLGACARARRSPPRSEQRGDQHAVVGVDGAERLAARQRAAELVEREAEAGALGRRRARLPRSPERRIASTPTAAPATSTSPAASSWAAASRCRGVRRRAASRATAPRAPAAASRVRRGGTSRCRSRPRMRSAAVAVGVGQRLVGVDQPQVAEQRALAADRDAHPRLQPDVRPRRRADGLGRAWRCPARSAGRGSTRGVSRVRIAVLRTSSSEPERRAVREQAQAGVVDEHRAVQVRAQLLDEGLDLVIARRHTPGAYLAGECVLPGRARAAGRPARLSRREHPPRSTACRGRRRSGRSSAATLKKTVPITAMPSAPPSCCIAFSTPEAEPTSSSSTPASTKSNSGASIAPMPMPASSSGPAKAQRATRRRRRRSAGRGRRASITARPACSVGRPNLGPSSAGAEARADRGAERPRDQRQAGVDRAEALAELQVEAERQHQADHPGEEHERGREAGARTRACGTGSSSRAARRPGARGCARATTKAASASALAAIETNVHAGQPASRPWISG